METSTAPAPGVPRLRRTLTLWDLIFYGIVLIQPIAPVPLYGVAQKLSDGHFVTIILIALFAMLITAVSYGRMGALYPTAGSAYTYVGRGLNPHLGFLAGWAMILDYLLQPLINTVWISTALHERYLLQIPYIAWAALIAGIMTVLNLAGVKSSARANKVLLAVMSVVVSPKLLKDAILPLIGFAFCGVIWFNLNIIAKTVGGIWFAVGIIYVGFKTNWFRSAPVMIDFRES